jgi:hypothetical protein
MPQEHRRQQQRTPKQQQGKTVMPLTSWMQATARKQIRDASKSSLASNSRDTSNSSELGKIGDLSDDRNPSNSMALVISNSSNVSQSRKATRWMPAITGTTATAENISNNRVST